MADPGVRLTDRRGERSAAWSGIVFAVLSIFWAIVAVSLSPPQLQSSSEEITAFYGDQSNRIWLLAGALALAFAGFLFLWFLGSLRSVLRRAEGDAGRHTGVAFAGGVTLAGLLFAFNSVNVAIPWALEASDAFRLDTDSTRLFEGVTNILAIQGALAGAVLIGATSTLARRAAVFPKWLAWAGLLIAALNVLLAVPFHGVSLILVPPWVVAVCLFVLPRTGGPRRKSKAGPPHSEAGPKSNRDPEYLSSPAVS